MRPLAWALLLVVSLSGCAQLKEIVSPAPPPPPAPSPPPAPKPAPVPQAPPPVLAPQASAEEERRLRTEAEKRIDGTERMVRQIDPRRLYGDQQESFLTIQSFLAKAREALSTRDVQRGFTLADKAYLLADELVRRLR